MTDSRTRFLLVAVAIVALASAGRAEDPEDGAIRVAVRAYFDAVEKRDLKALDACLGEKFSTVQTPTRELYLKPLATIFETLASAKYKTTIRSIRRNPSGTVSVRVDFEGRQRLKGETDDTLHEGNWSVILQKESGTWKWVAFQDAYALLVAELLEAKTRAERIALFRAEGDSYLSNEFIGKMMTEQKQLFYHGELVRAERAQSLLEDAVHAFEVDSLRSMYDGVVLQSRANLLMCMERYDDAVWIYQRLLFRYHIRGSKPFIVLVRVALGTALMGQGDFRAALRLLEGARVEMAEIVAASKGQAREPIFLELQKEIEPTLLNSIGEVRSAIGDCDIAARHFDRAIQLGEKNRDLHWDVVLLARSNRAALNTTRGKFAIAIREYEELLAIYESAKIPIGQAMVQNNLGRVLTEVGQFSEAIRRFHEARKLSTGRFRLGEAMAQLNLAQAHYNLGSDLDARSYAEEALANFRTLGDRANMARTLSILGQIAMNADRQKDAEKAFEEALVHTIAGGSKVEAARFAIVIGAHYERLGEREKAEKSFLIAESYYREFGDPIRIALIQLFNAQTRLRNGTIAFNLESLEAVKGELDRSNDSRLALRYHTTLGNIRLNEKNWPAAAAEYRIALRATEDRFAQVDDPLLKASFRAESTGALYDHYATALVAQRDDAGVFAVAERAKARSLTDLLARAKVSVRKAMTPAEATEEQTLREAIGASMTLARSGARFSRHDAATVKQLRQAEEDARTKYDQFRRQLYQKHPALPTQRGEFEPVSLTDVQKSIFAAHPDAAIVSYLVGFETTRIVVLTPGPTADGPAKVVVRSVPRKSTELVEAVAAFRSACTTPFEGDVATDDLWDWLIRPIENDIAGAKHLVIVPYAPLLAVPFHALKKSEGQYLVEKFSVSYAPSVGALLEMRKLADRRKQAPAPNEATPVFVVGRPKSTVGFPDLPATEAEAKAIGDLFAAPTQVVLGERATRAEVLQRAEAARVLHFATHGSANDYRPLFSALAVTQAAGDDGRLYAHDVLDLNLSAELVVLSACDSGRGKDYVGEGTLGLAWAFFVAGAPSVVVSHWQVADAATGTMMVDFHRRRTGAKPPSKAEALRQAQIELKKNPKTRHPYYWAPFVLTGDWR